MRQLSKKITSIMLLAVMTVTLAVTPVFAEADRQNFKVTSQSDSIFPKDQVESNFLEENGNEFHNAQYETNQFIIKFKNPNSDNKVITKLKNKIQSSKKFKGKMQNMSVVKTKSKMSKSDLLSEMKLQKVDSDILFIEPDYELTLSANDPYYSIQWGLGVDNALGSANVIPAWDVSEGEGIIVAVIDTGVDINHSDISANIFINSSEIPNNGIDDDNNGYVDDYMGVNVLNDNGNVDDDNGHGTHISGIIAGIKDNFEGIAGVSPRAKILPIKAFDNGISCVSNIIEAISYAENMGAKIANFSFETSQYSQALKDAIDASGLLFCCAAGNGGKNTDNTPIYPSCYDSANVISVGGMNKDGEIAVNSNFGANTVDVVAPSVDIISTLPGNTYGNKSGTSIGTAFVSGQCALLLSQDNTLSPAEVKSKIIASSEMTSALDGKVAGGKINCAGSLGIVPQSPIVTPPPIDDTISDTVYESVYDSTIIIASDNPEYSITQQNICPVFSSSVPQSNGQFNGKVLGATWINLANGGDCESIDKFHLVDGSTGTITLDSTIKAQGNNSVKVISSSINYDYAAYFDCGKLPAGCYLIEFDLKVNEGMVGCDLITDNDGSHGLVYDISSTSNFRTHSALTKLYTDVNSAKLCFYNCDAGNVSFNIDSILIKEISYDDYITYMFAPYMMAQKYDFINSVASTSSFRITSINDNKFDGELEYGNIDYTNGETIEDNTFIRSKNFQPIEPAKKYILSNDKGYTEATVYFYDTNKKYVGRRVANSNWFTSLSSAKYVKFAIKGNDLATKVKLEYGESATAYNPQEKSECYISLPNGETLKSLPFYNCYDEINLNTGEYIKRIGKKLFNGTEAWYDGSDLGTVYRFKLSNVTDISTWQKPKLVTMNDTYFPYIANLYLDEQHFFHEYGNIVDVFINKVTVDSQPVGSTPLEKFKYLLSNTPLEVLYELPEPQITKLNITPLMCYKNGTYVLEHVVKDIAVYNNGLQISNTKLPIENIEKIFKVNGSARIPVTSGYQVSADGKSIIIDGATNGEIYEFVYFYHNSLGTLPTIEFTVPTNTDAQIDDNTSALSKLTTLVNNLAAENAAQDIQIKELYDSLNEANAAINLLTEQVQTLQQQIAPLLPGHSIRYEYDDNGALIRRVVE